LIRTVRNSDRQNCRKSLVPFTPNIYARSKLPTLHYWHAAQLGLLVTPYERGGRGSRELYCTHHAATQSGSERNT